MIALARLGAKSSQSPLRCRFLTQKELDSDSIAFNSQNSRYHFPFRFYVPFRGLFGQFEPLRYNVARSATFRILIAANYSYGNCNPANNTDPQGLQVLPNDWSVYDRLFGKKSVGAGLGVGGSGHLLLVGIDVSCSAYLALSWCKGLQLCFECQVCAMYGPGLFIGGGLQVPVKIGEAPTSGKDSSIGVGLGGGKGEHAGGAVDFSEKGLNLTGNLRGGAGIGGFLALRICDTYTWCPGD